MSAPTTVRGNYGDLYGSSKLPVLEEIFRAGYDLEPAVWSKCFKVVPAKTDIWQATEIHDLPQFNEMAEGANYTYGKPNEGASKSFTIKKFGLGVSISEEVISDGHEITAAEMVRELGRSGAESQEIYALDVFNSGFTGTTVTSADGQNVFDTDHSLPGGATFRNELSAAADLSVTSLETMLTDFATVFVSDNGKVLNIMPKKILVHPSFYRLAKELIGSDLKPNDVSSDNGPTNAMNSFKQEGLMVEQSARLTDTDAWFMLADADKTGLRIAMRKPIETKFSPEAVGWERDSILVKSRYRLERGVTHAYGIFGSPGA